MSATANGKVSAVNAETTVQTERATIMAAMAEAYASMATTVAKVPREQAAIDVATNTDDRYIPRDLSITRTSTLNEVKRVFNVVSATTERLAQTITYAEMVDGEQVVRGPFAFLSLGRVNDKGSVDEWRVRIRATVPAGENDKHDIIYGAKDIDLYAVNIRRVSWLAVNPEYVDPTIMRTMRFGRDD